MRAAYVGDVLYNLVRNRKWPDEETIGADGGYLLTKAIPPENILEFIDMTLFWENQRGTEDLVVENDKVLSEEERDKIRKMFRERFKPDSK